MKKEQIEKHLLVLLTGFLHALKGAGAFASLAAATALFCCVANDHGYLAVVKFIAALLAIVIAMLLLYSCGRDLTGGKFSK